MKKVALYDAKNTLSALIQEVAETGEEIVITRHGKPTVKLVPIEEISAKSRREALDRLKALRDDFARRNPDAPSMTWDELKRLARDENDEGDPA